MPQLMNNSGSQNIDVGQLLKMLISPTANPQDAQNALGPASLQQIGASGKTSAEAVGPYQQGVIKALKDLGQNHVQEAVASGADPINDIQNHEIMRQNTIDQKPLDNTNEQQIKNNILNQLLQLSQPKGFLGRFQQNVAKTNGEMTDADVISNLLNVQKLAAGQPAEIALPQAQVSGLLQEQAGEKPIQPEQAAQLRASQNLAQITAMNDSIKNLQDRRNSLNTEFDQEGKTMSLMGRLGGLITFQGQQMTPRQKAIKVEQNGIDKVIARMQSKMSGFTPENPAALKGNSSKIPPAPKDATHYSPSTGKFYNAQGQEI